MNNGAINSFSINGASVPNWIVRAVGIVAVAAATVTVADASASLKSEEPPVQVTIARGNGLSEPPFDYAKVLALKQQIANGEYKVDYNKLAQSMIDADILGGGKK